MRLRLTLAYDGTHFSGWQSQTDGSGVQDAVESAFRLLCGDRIVVHGSGRTDAGVHASGQTAHVDVPNRRLPLADWLPALNANLPQGVRVMKLKMAPGDFHARFSARGKVYRYTVWNGPVMHPLWISRAWHVPWKLDWDLLGQANAIFCGRHDFAAFTARRPRVTGSTVRTVSAIRFSRNGPRLTLTYEGEGFLYKMVRMLAAATIRCAAGRLEPGDISRVLADAGPRTSHVAPSGGLSLERVIY
jgi:tRNA pseudouridine38-40 synthase